jgi:hypothetical protein
MFRILSITLTSRSCLVELAGDPALLDLPVSAERLDRRPGMSFYWGRDEAKWLIVIDASWR